MKIIKQNVEYIDQPKNDYLQWLEKIGRTCYKSEDKITKYSSKNFIENIIKNKHLSVLEHLYFTVQINDFISPKSFNYDIISKNPFIKIVEHNPMNNYDTWNLIINLNLRTIIELQKEYPHAVISDLLNFIIDKTNLPKEKVYNTYGNTVKFKLLDNNETASFRIITDRGVTHELVRHRIASYSQESTRYCSYNKDKFGNECTFILPLWFYDNIKSDEKIYNNYHIWENACKQSEKYYFQLLNDGQSPQMARTVLNNSLKTEIVTTMRLSMWKHFLSLRTSEKAHPQMKDIALQIHEILKEKFPKIF